MKMKTKIMRLTSLITLICLLSLPLFAYAARLPGEKASPSKVPAESSKLTVPRPGGNQLPPYTIITVTDGTSPLASVTVHAKLGGVSVQGNSTDANGNATFSNLASGSYSFTAERNGYSSGSVNLTVTNGQRSTGVITLTRLTGNAVVTVSDDAGGLVSGAAVHAMFSVNTVQTAITDAAGKATFTKLPTGVYTIRAVKSGYIGDGTTQILTVTTGAPGSAAVKLRQTASVTVTVLDGGNPVSGASVGVTINGNPQSAATGADGKATLINVPVGSQRFAATKAGYAPGYATIMIAAGATTAAATITLTRNTGDATIAVLYGSGPASGAKVSATVNGAVRTETADSAGKAIFTNLPPGNYSFKAALSGTNDRFTTVTVTAGAMAAGTIALESPGTIAVTVTDDAGPLGGATVSAGTGAAIIKTATTDASGKASISLPPGSYTLSASKTGYRAGQIGVSVQSGATVTRAIALVKGGNVTITVLHGADPVGGATVTVPVSGTIRTVTTDSAGKASFTNLPAGTYVFTAAKTNYANGTVTVAAASGETAAGTIALEQAGRIVITVKQADSSSTVSGATVSVPVSGAVLTVTTDNAGKATFTNLPAGAYAFTAAKTGYAGGNTVVTVANNAAATGTISMAKYGRAVITVKEYSYSSPAWIPVSGAAVSTTVSGAVRTVTTDSAGQASFADLPVANYTFKAAKASYADNTLNVHASNGNYPGTGEIILSSLNYPSYTVKGVTIDAGYGKMLPGTTVRLGNAYSAVSDATGAYKIEGVLPGTYQISVTYPGYHLTFTECNTPGNAITGSQITIGGKFSNTVHLTFRLYKN